MNKSMRSMLLRAGAIRRRFRRAGRQTSLGVDVGQFETKLVWLEKKKQTFDVAFAKFETFTQSQSNQSRERMPEERRQSGCNPFKSKLVKDPSQSTLWDSKRLREVAFRIVNTLGEPNAIKSNVVLNLSMEACDIRGLCLSEQDQGAKALQLALREACGGNESYSIARLPNLQTDTAKVRVFSIPHSLTNSIVAALEQENLKPRRIDGLPWCMQRLTSSLPEVGRDTVLPILDWSFGNPMLCLATPKEVKYVRRLKSGGLSELLSHAQRELELNPAGGNRWLQRCFQEAQLIDGETGELPSLAKAICQQIRSEIRAALDFASWHLRGDIIDKIMVVGGGAALPGLIEYLQREMGAEVIPWSRKIGDTQLTPEYAIASSLAMLGASDAS